MDAKLGERSHSGFAHAQDILVFFSTLVITVLLILWYGDKANLADIAIAPLKREEDALLHNFYLWQAFDNLLHHPLDLGASEMFYGISNSFGYTVAPYGTAIQAFPLYLITGKNITLTANLYTILVFGLTAWLIYRLVLYLFDTSWLAALFAAWAFTFSPFRVSHLAHFETISFHLIIAMMWVLHRLLDSPTWWRGMLLGLIFALNLATNAYFAVFAFLMLGIMAVYTLLAFRSQLTRDRLISLATAGITAGVCCIPFVLLRLRTFNEVPPIYRSIVLQRSASLLVWGTPIGWLWHRLGFTVPVEVARPLWIGLIVLICIIVGARLIYQDTTRRGFYSHRQLVIVYGLLGLAGFLLSFGPRQRIQIGTDGFWMPMPFELVDQLPGFAGIRAPRRFGMITHLSAALIGGHALHLIQTRTRWLRQHGISLAAIGFLALDLLPLHHEAMMVTTYPPLNSLIFEKLAEDPPGSQVVMHYPIDKLDLILVLSQQAIHQQPMITGVASYYPSELAPLISHYTGIEGSIFADDLLQLAIERGATRVVVHRELLSEEEVADYEAHRNSSTSLWRQLDYQGLIGLSDLYIVPEEMQTH